MSSLIQLSLLGLDVDINLVGKTMLFFAGYPRLFMSILFVTMMTMTMTMRRRMMMMVMMMMVMMMVVMMMMMIPITSNYQVLLTEWFETTHKGHQAMSLPFPSLARAKHGR